jgi:TRAP-type C4-dicarboxylate transport system substrate-binding protein
MELRKTAVRGAAVLLALVATACADRERSSGDARSAEGSLADMEPLTLKYNDSIGPTTGAAEATRAFFDEVEEQSDGKITFEEYFASSLLVSTEALDGVGSGVADISQVTVQAYPDRLPVSHWLSRAAAYLDPGFPATGVQGIMGGATFALANDELQQEYADANIVVLRSGSSNFGNAICSEPIETLADAKGKRIRVAGEPAASEATAIGMEPVTTSASEMFEALQRGAVDCVTASDGGEAYQAVGLTDIAKYYVPIRFSPTTFNTIAINRDVWESMPADAQKIVREAWATYESERLAATMKGFGSFMTHADEKGIQFTDPVEVNAALAAYQEQAVADLVDEAPAAVTDPEALLAAYEAVLDEVHPTAEGVLTGEAVEPGAAMADAYRGASELVDVEAAREAYLDLFGSVEE